MGARGGHRPAGLRPGPGWGSAPCCCRLILHSSATQQHTACVNLSEINSPGRKKGNCFLPRWEARGLSSPQAEASPTQLPPALGMAPGSPHPMLFRPRGAVCVRGVQAQVSSLHALPSATQCGHRGKGSRTRHWGQGAPQYTPKTPSRHSPANQPLSPALACPDSRPPVKLNQVPRVPWISALAKVSCPSAHTDPHLDAFPDQQPPLLLAWPHDAHASGRAPAPPPPAG